MFGLTSRRHGPFGRPDTSEWPYRTPGIGEGRFPETHDYATAPARRKGGGFFGREGTGRTIAGSIGDYLREMGGMDALYAPQMMLRERAEAEEAEAQRRRMEAREDKQWEWQNKPQEGANNDTVNDYRFITETLGPDAANQYLRNLGDPIVTVQLPGGRVYSGPRSGMSEALSGGAAPTAPVGRLTPIDGGGPTPQASGGFRGLPGEQVTSTLRSPQRNRDAGGVPNSYHLSGRARDSVPPPGMSMERYAAELQRLNPHLEVINEGDHVHMEPRG